jgi:hypothetical protein
LGTSADDAERADSKVKIAIVLDLMGKDEEAATFLQEAKELDPAALSLWSDGAGDLLVPEYRTGAKANMG